MAVSAQRAVDDILECPICIETMNDSRALPCMHTFCFKCIQKYGSENRKDNEISCPVCRNTCRVPAGGFEELRKNILLEKLLEIRALMVETTTSVLQCSSDNCVMTKNMGSARLCQTLRHDNWQGNSSPLASSYCAECQGYMCSDCSKGHTQQSGTGSHHVLTIGCSEHPERPLEFYCKTCKTPICDACSSSKHRRHKCSSLCTYVSSLQSEIKLFRSQISDKETLERENQMLKSQIARAEALECENKTLKSKIADNIKKMAHETKITKAQSEQIRQLESANEKLKSRIAKFEHGIEISEAKEAFPGKLQNEIVSLKTKVAELSQYKNKTEHTYTEFHHLSWLGHGESRKADCTFQSCEQVMLLCRSCKRELCLHCFKKHTATEKVHDAVSFHLVIIMILIGLGTLIKSFFA